MLVYAVPELAHYRLKELEASAARARPARQLPPEKIRPAPLRVAVFRSRRVSLAQIALETT